MHFALPCAPLTLIGLWAYGRYGLQTLFRYYSYGLEQTWHAGRFRDFQVAVLKDLALGSDYGLEKLWAFIKFRDQDAPWVSAPSSAPRPPTLEPPRSRSPHDASDAV